MTFRYVIRRCKVITLVVVVEILATLAPPSASACSSTTSIVVVLPVHTYMLDRGPALPNIQTADSRCYKQAKIKLVYVHIYIYIYIYIQDCDSKMENGSVAF